MPPTVPTPISPGAWELLKALHDAQNLRRPDPDLGALWQEAAELRNKGLAINFGTSMVVTEKGEAALRERLDKDK